MIVKAKERPAWRPKWECDRINHEDSPGRCICRAYDQCEGFYVVVNGHAIAYYLHRKDAQVKEQSMQPIKRRTLLV